MHLYLELVAAAALALVRVHAGPQPARQRQPEQADAGELQFEAVRGCERREGEDRKARPLGKQTAARVLDAAQRDAAELARPDLATANGEERHAQGLVGPTARQAGKGGEQAARGRAPALDVGASLPHA